MDLDFFCTKDKDNSKINSFFSSFKKELKNSLNKNQLLVIDRFEENIAVCENQNNGKIVNIDKNLIPSEAIEGMTIKFYDDKYVVDYENCILTRKMIVDELKNTWKKEDGAEYYIVSSILDKAVKCSNIYMKQNIYIKNEELIKTMKKGDIIKLIDEKYIIDEEKNTQINEKIKNL